MFNEAYCRDASIKTRSQLEIKRRRGDFIGAFPVFGYRKDPENHNRLLADDYAAGVVRDIFRWKLDGVSTGDIADRLTEAGVPTPMDYKRSQGLHYTTKFRKNVESVWCAKMVLRILKNPVYIGTLEQGRVTTPGYNIKRLVNKPREEWAVVENNHEAIIDRQDFEVIQNVLALDTRTSVSGQAVETFSGMVFCGECGGSMVRKTVPSGKKKFVYYVCAVHKADRGRCSSHSMRDTVLEEIVLDFIKQRIRDVLDLASLLEITSTAQLQQANMRQLQRRLERQQMEISRAQTLLRSLYENLADGLIDRQEYQDLKKTYTRRRNKAEELAEAIREEMSRELSGSTENRAWMEHFRKYQNVDALDRAMVVTLVERVLIYREHRIEIVFRWQNEYQALAELLARRGPLELGAV